MRRPVVCSPLAKVVISHKIEGGRPRFSYFRESMFILTNASQNRGRTLEPAASADLLRQEQRFARACQVLRDAIQERAFPGAAFSVLWRGELIALSGVGGFTYETDSPRVKGETVYDLASVSKVVATTTMAMI